MNTRRLRLLRRPLHADEKNSENWDRLRNDGDRRLQEVEEEHEHHVVYRSRVRLATCGFPVAMHEEKHTVIVVALDKLEKGAHDDNHACDGTEAHGDAEADFFPPFELQLSEDQPREQSQQDVDDASRPYKELAHSR